MILNLSQDFTKLAKALSKLYEETFIEFPSNKPWTHDLSNNTDEHPIRRLTIIGHGDSLYDDEQSMFGGNRTERVMLTEEFAHSLITLLKYNERFHPGFCKKLKHIDIIDHHKSEQKFKCEEIAAYLHADHFLKENGTHICVNGFANPNGPKLGTALLMNAKDHTTLIFYVFDSVKAFKEYKAIQTEYDELKSELHHMKQMPGRYIIKSSPAESENREEKIEALKAECNQLLLKSKEILHQKAHRISSITDPRHYFKQHPECQIKLAKVTKHPHQPHPFEKEHQNHDTIPNLGKKRKITATAKKIKKSQMHEKTTSAKSKKK